MRNLVIPFVLMVASSTSAATITSGTADLGTADSLGVGPESFSLSGPGFSFTGIGINSEYPCTLIACVPGGLIPFADLSSEDRRVVGTITLGNRSFDYL